MINANLGTVSYQPRPGFYGNDTFYYEINDGYASVLGTVNVTVNDTSLAHNLSQFGLTGLSLNCLGGSRVLADGRWEVWCQGGTCSHGPWPV